MNTQRELLLTFCTKTVEALNQELGVKSDQGLNDTEVAERQKKFGANEMHPHQIGIGSVFARQFKSAFIYLLLIAAAIVIVAGETLDGIIIIIFVLINATLGFVQEYRSERALKLLQQYVKTETSVRRHGELHRIDARELVPGDIVIIQTGDSVPADVRLLKVSGLLVNETALTGESVAVDKDADALEAQPADLYAARNLCFSGTSVVQGEAEGIVIATGLQTAIGNITQLTTEAVKESNFAKGIGRFSKFILQMILITLVFVFVANRLIKGSEVSLIEQLVFSLALAVSVIPEALPVVSTVSLSRGAVELAKRKVVVKRLTSIEDIGGIDVLCSDKTGTLTENKLSLTHYWPQESEQTLLFGNLAAQQDEEKHEPFDAALWEAAPDDVRRQIDRYTRITEFPFDPVRRLNGVVVQNGVKTFSIIRGAPDEILKRCTTLDAGTQAAAAKWLRERGHAGERVLAIATGPAAQEILPDTPYELIGIMSFVDPIKESTFRAVTKARALGVSMKIITGDAAEVAGAVAQQIKLTAHPDHVMSGSDFEKLSLMERRQAVENFSVFARVNPEQKFAIIDTLQSHHNVGFLGEGINDAPALKRAGVSLVVQSAASIAREAADIILLQKNLEVIIDGIEYGRTVFANTIKYLKATLASNFGNFYAIALGSLFISYLPMLPLQILLVNLLSDFPMISIATDNVKKSEVTRPQRYNVREIVYIATVLGVVSTVFDFMFFGFFFREAPAVLQTNWFMGSILTELVFLFSIRTSLPFYKAAKPSRYILFLTGAAVVLTVLIPYLPFGQSVFKFAPPSIGHLAIIFGLVIAYFACSEIVKNMFYKLATPHTTSSHSHATQ
ncbi:MAG: HAD-IC family P-type ATPase [Candidatus Kerfeldbacteria bacterium]|nr:HAD-IC family P-type ATPase [Candidatus Kerfeldbacteria bacterium]